MKKILTLTSIASVGAVLALLVACQTTASQAVVQKEALLSQSGFKVVTVKTPKQQQAVNGLAQNRCSAVKYNGTLYYVFPTATKDRIYVGKQAQFNAYKKAVAAQQAQPAGSAGELERSATATNAARRKPLYGGETAGPNHIEVEEFQGSGFAPFEALSECNHVEQARRIRPKHPETTAMAL